MTNAEVTKAEDRLSNETDTYLTYDNATHYYMGLDPVTGQVNVQNANNGEYELVHPRKLKVDYDRTCPDCETADDQLKLAGTK